MTKEMRQATRYPLIANAEIVELQTGARIKARTSDLSLVGCYLDTLNPLPPSTNVQLQITHLGETFRTFGTVAHSMSNMGMGIEFTTTDQDQKKILRKWLDNLSGATDP
jgi:hypothetical protein